MGTVGTKELKYKSRDFSGVPVVKGASQVAPEVKNPLANAGDVRDVDSIPVSGGSLGEGHGNPLCTLA